MKKNGSLEADLEDYYKELIWLNLILRDYSGGGYKKRRLQLDDLLKCNE